MCGQKTIASWFRDSVRFCFYIMSSRRMFYLDRKIGDGNRGNNLARIMELGVSSEMS